MPYLSQKRKDQLKDPVLLPSTPGDLTYLLTRAVLDNQQIVIAREECRRAIKQYMVGREVRYALFAEVLGCLLSTRLEYERRTAAALRDFGGSRRGLNIIDPIIDEFYREEVAPYEDEKIEQNGDVYQ